MYAIINIPIYVQIHHLLMKHKKWANTVEEIVLTPREFIKLSKELRQLDDDDRLSDLEVSILDLDDGVCYFGSTKVHMDL